MPQRPLKNQSLESQFDLRFVFTVEFYPRKYIHSSNCDFKFSNARELHLQKYEPNDQYRLNPKVDSVCT